MLRQETVRTSRNAVSLDRRRVGRSRVSSYKRQVRELTCLVKRTNTYSEGSVSKDWTEVERMGYWSRLRISEHSWSVLRHVNTKRDKNHDRIRLFRLQKIFVIVYYFTILLFRLSSLSPGAVPMRECALYPWQVEVWRIQGKMIGDGAVSETVA